MNMNIFLGLILPLIGTSAGAACVFVMRRQMNALVQKALLGFASGVMVAASVWSLLIPAMEMSSALGRLSFLPAVCGLIGGIAFLLLLDWLIPHLHLGSDEAEGHRSSHGKQHADHRRTDRTGNYFRTVIRGECIRVRIHFEACKSTEKEPVEERDLHRYKRLQRSNGKSIKMRKTLSEGSVFFVR